MVLADHALQLGSLVLDLEAGHSLVLDEKWYPLTPQIIHSIDWPTSSRDLASTIGFLLQDEGLGFTATYKREVVGLVVRVSIAPSDDPTSLWKRTSDHKGKRSSHLKKLFYELRQGWDGQGDWLMKRSLADQQKMPDLYACIPSPPEPHFPRDWAKTMSEREICMRLMHYEEPEGIHTTLYQYQLRSVSKMLQMETQPGRLVDPNFTPLEESGRKGTYFLNTATWDIQRHPGWYDLPRGGILCEQMGVGKTLMCLSLVVATLDTPPHLPTSTLDISPVLSDHILSTYPFPSQGEAREKTSYSRTATKLALPSLTDLCATVLAKYDRSARRSPFIPTTYSSLLDQKTFYYVYPSDDDCQREAKRRVQCRHITKVYLANTTLVVVPQILVQQWKFEIEKHLVPGVLKYLEVGKDELPAVEGLIEYDMILMDVNRFAQEETMHRSRQELEPSELTKARWKRIILDEGHVAGDKTSNAMRLAISLSVERRWLVSGTPTKHLQQGGEAEIESMSLSSTTNAISTSSASNQPPKKLSWSRRDLEDATRIGVMIGGFLSAEPFKSDVNFQERVTALLRGKDGPKFGAVRRLRYIMGATMVKHAPKVIDQEASLPPSTLSTEILQFHPMQRITYNVLASLIASNVYTSNFEDPDYFLHPKNTTDFNLVIRNLHLACFWYSAQEMGVAECLDRTRHHLKTNQTVTPQGRAVLEEAVEHLERALATPGWSEWMVNGVSLPFDASSTDFSQRVRSAWSDSVDTNPDAIDALSLQILRDLNRPGMTMHDLHIAGWDHRATKHPDFFKEMERVERQSEGVERRSERKDMRQPPSEQFEKEKRSKEIKAAAQVPTSTSPQKQTRKGQASKKKGNLDHRLDEAAWNAIQSIRVGTPQYDFPPRPLPTVIRTKSRSAKVNFVLDTISASQQDEKFVVFGDEHELAHIREALELFDIKLCFASHSVVLAKRVDALRQFERPEMKVCLLDLKLGARGLNLVVANRMIFISPVWNLDVQAQAIKRVHRIGQTKPTKIEILVTEGTFEEDIANRAYLARSEKEEQMYSRALIENPRFVYPESEGDKTFTIRFVPMSERLEAQESTPPGSDTPTDVSPLTPVFRRDTDRVEIVFPSGSTSPTPTPTQLTWISTEKIEVKRAGENLDEVKPKKIRKVAFA